MSRHPADEPLARDGGPTAKLGPFGAGPRFDADELEQVRQALDQQTLFYAHGQKVEELEQRASEYYRCAHAVTASSGTAAIHAAVGAAGVEPGDEVITTPVTDFGTVIGVLYQNAIPVFCDVDLATMQMTPETVEAAITPRTRAIIVVHWAGAPADVAGICAVARPRGIVVIEDCAQAWDASIGDRLVGTIGDLGCFSLNDYKHISVGDGGLVVTNDAELAHRARLFTDKSYSRGAGARLPQFLGANYRMSELCGAVGLAQFAKMPGIAAARQRHGERLDEILAGLPGIAPQRQVPGGRSTYYRYNLLADPAAFRVPLAEVAAAVSAEGVPTSLGGLCPGNGPLYAFDVFRQRSFFGEGAPWPAEVVRGELPQVYAPGLCPVAERLFEVVLGCRLREHFTTQDIEEMGVAFSKVTRALAV